MIRKANPKLRMFLLVLLTLGLLGLPALAQDGSDDGNSNDNGDSQTQEDSVRDNNSDADRTENTEEAARDRDDAAAGEAATETPAPAVGRSRLVEVPTEPGMQEPGDAAWLRVINLSPNIGPVDFNLEYRSDDAVHPTIPDFMQGVEYEENGTYAELPAGQYTLHLPGDRDRDHDFTVNSGNFYTLVVYGLELPPEAEADEREEGGFMGWLRGLFGGDDGNDAYHLDTQLIEDNLYHNNLTDEAIVRVMNAAPGAEDVTLAVEGESGTLTGNAAYGEVTGTNRLDPREFSGPLELRLSGSRAATIALEDVGLTAGTVNTVFLVGTPIEDAPLHAIVLSTPAFSDSF